MIISIINLTNGLLGDEEIQKAIRAINRQIAEDFEPYWSFGARLRLEGNSTSKPSAQSPADMRGDAILYIWDKTNMKDALGYHWKNNKGIPYGFVFTALSKQLGEEWSVTLSHEALELIGDPQVNLLVQGPHPGKSGKVVFHSFEMCDAVQDETYEIDGIQVSNFVLPLYFTETDEVGGRNDFLGREYGGKKLASFGINPGGYISFFDPKTGKWGEHLRKADKRAAERMKIKQQAATGRSNLRKQGRPDSGGGTRPTRTKRPDSGGNGRPD
jgi:hypothetical protein